MSVADAERNGLRAGDLLEVSSPRSSIQTHHWGEAELERELHAVGERHATFHEVRYVTVDLPRWSLETGRRSPAATATS